MLNSAAAALHAPFGRARKGLCPVAMGSQKYRWNRCFSYFSKQATKTKRAAALEHADILIRLPTTTTASANAARYTLR